MVSVTATSFFKAEMAQMSVVSKKKKKKKDGASAVHFLRMGCKTKE